jgi:hypothetical protein
VRFTASRVRPRPRLPARFTPSRPGYLWASRCGVFGDTVSS